MELPQLTPDMITGCSSVPGWTNGHGKGCDVYSAYCPGGTLSKEFEWLGGSQFNFPEKSCCACGRAAYFRVPPPPPPAATLTVHGYALHINSFCRGADREVKKDSFAACEAHCASRKCACAHFGGGKCRFAFTYVGLLRSNEGFSAFVRPGAESDPGAVAAAAREAKAAAAAGAPTCGTPTPRRVPPNFYMYDGPTFMWGQRLAACYAAKNGHAPWAMPTTFHNNSGYTESGPAPQADLSHSLWLHASLASHRHRLKQPDEAHLFVVPAFGSLSEATGTCEGTTQ